MARGLGFASRRLFPARGSIQATSVILLALHIPDGFLSVPVAALGWLFALPALALALFGSRDTEDRAIPLAGILAAFVFAAQTLQFPIPGGTTGHLVGSTLVTVLLGPGLGLVVLTSVLLLQAVVFGEGGLLALGWNTTNMAVVMGMLGYGAFHLFRRRGVTAPVSAFCAAWLATQFGSLVTCLEIAIPPQTSPLLVSLPAMMATQGLVGIGEGIVTASAVAYISKSRKEAIAPASSRALGCAVFVLVLVVVSSILPPGCFSLASQVGFPRRYPALCVVSALALITLLAWFVLGLLPAKKRSA